LVIRFVGFSYFSDVIELICFMHNLQLNFVVGFSLIYVVDFFNYAMKNIERRWILKFICNYGLLRCVIRNLCGLSESKRIVFWVIYLLNLQCCLCWKKYVTYGLNEFDSEVEGICRKSIVALENALIKSVPYIWNFGSWFYIAVVVAVTLQALIVCSFIVLGEKGWI